MSNFKAKMHQNRPSPPQAPLGELTALLQTPSWNKRDILLREGEGRKGRGRGKKRRNGRGGRDRKGRGEKGKERKKGRGEGRIDIPILVCLRRRWIVWLYTLYITVHPLFASDREVVSSGPELLVRVFGLHHRFELRKLSQLPLEQFLFSVDVVACQSCFFQRRRHLLQRLHVVPHVLHTRQLQSWKTSRFVDKNRTKIISLI